MKKLSLILVALLLTACGGSESYNPPGKGPDTPMPGPPAPPAPVADAFLSQVEKSAAAMPDDKEGDNVDAVVSTQPDDTEPKAL